MRRKNSRKHGMAIWMCLCLMVCAILLPDATTWQRVTLLVAAAVVNCVWIACESMVDRAAAPLNLPDLPDRPDEKPPDGGKE